jgi:bifunctional non-homologous end joining protein LigD
VSERLERYRKMRDFARTPEPSGARVAPASAGALRYYVQRHAARRLHYDFRLELGGVLRSWAVPKGPSLDPAERRLAVETEDHPLDYGEFEGVIPEKQYGAGEVLLWDQGTWWTDDPDPAASLARGKLDFRLRGRKLSGGWKLRRMAPREGEKPAWLLIKSRDEAARAGDEAEITMQAPASVKEVPKRARRASASALPQFVAPQLATLVNEPPRHGDWLYEVKHDGYRLLARIERGSAQLFTRGGHDWTAKMPSLARALGALKLKQAWLDGEVVVLNEKGVSSFQALQNAFESGSEGRMVYFVFDAPHLEGHDLTRLPLRERKRRLAQVLGALPAGPVRLSEHLNAEGREALEQACRLGLEGLIGKLADSVYVPGRTRSWIKLKCRLREEFVIGGFTTPGGSRQGFGALLVGTFDPAGRLIYAGRVGTGFDEEALARLARRFGPLRKDDCPFHDPPREAKRNAHWLRPSLVAEVAYASRTDEGLLRHASFLGLREDRPAKTVVGIETPQPPPDVPAGKPAKKQTEKALPNSVRGVRISHPDRLVWPALGITKLELARYYDAVGDWLLPHVANRPLTMVRCPDGAEAQCFFQRHLNMGKSPGQVLTFKRERSSKGHYIYVNTLEAVVSVVQNGAVELHTWGATVPDVRHPDRITMDLDPDPELPWKRLREATELTRRLLDGLGLKCFLKTTGGKGLHVVAPIERRHDWDEVKAFAQHIAAVLARAEPGLFTANIAKARRTGRIFVDYLRNAETASAVCAYSARARAGATVSVPVHWDELDSDDLRARFDVRSVPRRLTRLRADPWADYWTTRQAINSGMRKALDRAAG